MVRVSAMLLGLVCASNAWAKDVAVAPLVASGVDKRTAGNITGLVTTELEFLGAFDSVNQLRSAPKGLTSSCIKSSPCMKKAADAAGTRALVSGIVQSRGRNLNLTLSYFDDGRIVREKTFQVKNSTTVLADNMGAMVKEVITGVSPEDVAREASLGAFSTLGAEALLDDTDDFALDEDAGGVGNADELADELTETGDLIQDDPMAATDGGIDSIEFAAAAPSEIGVEEIEIESAAAFISLDPAPAASQEPAAASAFSGDLGLDEPDETKGRRGKEPRDRKIRERPEREPRERNRVQDNSPERTATRTPRERTGSADEINSTVHLALHAGFTQYQVLGFLTYGPELQIRPGAGSLVVAAGFDGYSVRREIPEEFLQEGEPPTQWNTIFPIHVGVQYSRNRGTILPFAGADVIAIPGYVKNAGDMALGGRARVGTSLLFTSGVGLNLDVNVGYLTGKGFTAVQQDMQPSGVTAGASLGTIVLF